MHEKTAPSPETDGNNCAAALIARIALTNRVYDPSTRVVLPALASMALISSSVHPASWPA
jgi:hypothetical protein